MTSYPRGVAERTALEGIDCIVAFEVPLRRRFRGLLRRHGLLLHGAAGWAEWSPFDEYTDEVSTRWLAAALEAASTAPPPARRMQVPVNVTVPAIDPASAYELVVASGCRTAKVKVAEAGQHLTDDVERLRAVRAAIGPSGSIRVDANGAWTVDEALAALEALVDAAAGLEYAEQPCATLAELAEVRARSSVRVAADEAIRRDGAAIDDLREAVDVAVVKLQPSGGRSDVLRLAEGSGLPVVVSSALETSVGLAAGVLLAAALPGDATGAIPACGLATALLLADDVVSPALLPVDGSIDVEAARAATAELVSDVPAPDAAMTGWMFERLASCARSLHAATEASA